jgi:hypothetical protein
MKNPKVGERIKVFGYRGAIWEVTGTVEEVDGPSVLKLKADNGNTYHAHPRQCVRLKKKARREWVLSITPQGFVRGVGGIGETGSHVHWGDFYSDNEKVVVREVRKKEKA